MFCCCCPCCSLRFVIRQKKRRQDAKEIADVQVSLGNEEEFHEFQSKHSKNQDDMDEDLLSVMDNDYKNNMMDEYAASIHYTKYEDKFEKQLHSQNKKKSNPKKNKKTASSGLQENLLDGNNELNNNAAGEIEYQDNETDKDYEPETEVNDEIEEDDDL